MTSHGISKNRYWLLVVMVLSGGLCLFADLGSPDLNALCRITLRDGSVIEGAVLAANGGFQRYWDVNGFYVTERGEPGPFRSDFRIPVLFDFGFKAFEPGSGQRFMANGRIGGINFQGREPLVYYMEDLTFTELHINDTKIDERFDFAGDGSSGRLCRAATTTCIYRLSDFVPVYTEIPDGIYLEERARQSLADLIKLAPVRMKRIPVRDIQKFELLRESPKCWLDAIAAKTARLKEAIARCEDCELLLPVWYHDVVKAPPETLPAFKPWLTE